MQPIENVHAKALAEAFRPTTTGAQQLVLMINQRFDGDTWGHAVDVAQNLAVAAWVTSGECPDGFEPSPCWKDRPTSWSEWDLAAEICNIGLEPGDRPCVASHADMLAVLAACNAVVDQLRAAGHEY